MQDLTNLELKNQFRCNSSVSVIAVSTSFLFVFP